MSTLDRGVEEQRSSHATAAQPKQARRQAAAQSCVGSTRRNDSVVFDYDYYRWPRFRIPRFCCARPVPGPRHASRLGGNANDACGSLVSIAEAAPGSGRCIPQAGRGPALPVLSDSSLPPLPRSSVPAWTTTVRCEECQPWNIFRARRRTYADDAVGADELDVRVHDGALGVALAISLDVAQVADVAGLIRGGAVRLVVGVDCGASARGPAAGPSPALKCGMQRAGDGDDVQ